MSKVNKKYIVEIRRSGECVVKPKSLRYRVKLAKTAVVAVNAGSELQASNAVKSFTKDRLDMVFGMAGNDVAVAEARCIDETFAPLSSEEISKDLSLVDFSNIKLGVKWDGGVEIVSAARLVMPQGGWS